MPDLAAKRWAFCQPENRHVSVLGGTEGNLVTKATLIILKVEIRVVNFATNLTRILTVEIRIVNVSTSTTLILAREILEEMQFGLVGSEKSGLRISWSCNSDFINTNPNWDFRDKCSSDFQLWIRIDIFATNVTCILNFISELRFSQQLQLGFSTRNPNWDFRQNFRFWSQKSALCFKFESKHNSGFFRQKSRLFVTNKLYISKSCMGHWRRFQPQMIWEEFWKWCHSERLNMWQNEGHSFSKTMIKWKLGQD